MKILSLLLTPLVTLVLCCHWCFAGQPDAGVIGVGEWSEPVSDGDGHTLRGRLVVGDDRSASASNHARVYLELEHVFKGGLSSPLEVYYDIGGKALNLELRDGHDQPVPQTPMSIQGEMPLPCWITLPCDATVRLRGDLYGLGHTVKPESLQVLLGSGNWIIPANAAGEFCLSGTFTPPADHPSALNYHVWQGTLKLPKVKIPPPKAVTPTTAAALARDYHLVTTQLHGAPASGTPPELPVVYVLLAPDITGQLNPMVYEAFDSKEMELDIGVLVRSGIIAPGSILHFDPKPDLERPTEAQIQSLKDYGKKLGITLVVSKAL